MGAFLKTVFSEWSKDKASYWAAAVAYYAIFSLGPLLLIAIAIAGLIFGSAVASQDVMARMQDTLGPDGAHALQSLLMGANKLGAGAVAALVGLGLLLWAASSLFSCLQDALHTMWDISPAPTAGVRGFIRTHLLSTAMVIAIGILLLASLTASMLLTAVARLMSNLLPMRHAFLAAIDFGLSLLLTTLLFAALFKFLPLARVRWRDIWVGALLTALLFTLGKIAIGLYIGNSNPASTYGAAGSLIVLLLWVNYSSQILFLGAEFTKVYARRYGEGIQPGRGAVQSS